MHISPLVIRHRNVQKDRPSSPSPLRWWSPLPIAKSQVRDNFAKLQQKHTRKLVISEKLARVTSFILISLIPVPFLYSSFEFANLPVMWYISERYSRFQCHFAVWIIYCQPKCFVFGLHPKRAFHKRDAKLSFFLFHPVFLLYQSSLWQEDFGPTSRSRSEHPDVDGERWTWWHQRWGIYPYTGLSGEGKNQWLKIFKFSVDSSLW